MTDLTEAKRLVEAVMATAVANSYSVESEFCTDDGAEYRQDRDEIERAGVVVSTLFAEHEAALRENEALRDMVDQLALELRAELDGRYHGMLDHPAMKNRYNRDMSTVHEARALLGDRS